MKRFLNWKTFDWLRKVSLHCLTNTREHLINDTVLDFKHIYWFIFYSYFFRKIIFSVHLVGFSPIRVNCIETWNWLDVSARIPFFSPCWHRKYLVDIAHTSQIPPLTSQIPRWPRKYLVDLVNILLTSKISRWPCKYLVDLVNILLTSEIPHRPRKFLVIVYTGFSYDGVICRTVRGPDCGN